MSMRIRGAKTELEEAGESTDGMAESTASLRAEMLALSGVDIMLNEDTFKSTYQIMDELSHKWEDLSDIAQATIIELVAGKHQGNVFSSLMANFDTARAALDTSINSSGSAMAEHAKWSESLEARLNKLKSTWQSLSQTFLKSHFLKVGIDFITGFVDVLDILIDKIGTIPTILGAIGIGKGIGGLLSLSGDIKSFSDIFTALGMVFPNVAGGIKIFTTALASGTKGLALMKAAASGLWTVIAAHPILAAVAALGIAFVAFDKFTESADELAERIEGVTSKYKEQHDSLIKLKGDYDTSKEDSLISKYGELSKGVNALGENISLTADEYAEYQSIVETIANQNPELVSGYNSQGDAILSCAGNVDKLAESYKNLIKEQNKDVLDTGEDIFKDFKNDLKESSAYYTTDGRDDYNNPIKIDHFDTKHFDELEKLMNLSGDELDAAIEKLTMTEVERISGLLNEQGIERNVMFDGEAGWETQREHIIRALGKDKAEIKKVLDEASADLNAYAEDMGTVTEAFFSTAFLGGNDSDIGDYSDISERMQNIITQATSGLDAEFYADFLNKENPYEELVKYYNSLLDTFNNLNNVDAARFEAAFDLKTQFNSGDISYGEYVKGIQDAEKLVDGLGLGDEFTSQIKLALNTEEVTENYDALKERLTSDEYNIQMKTDEAEKFLNELSASEYSVAVDLIANGKIDFNDFDIKSLREYIEKQAKLNEAMNFTIAMDVETESLESLNTAMAESVSGAGLSSEAIAALKGRYAELESEGYNLSAMFEETSNGIHLNREAVSELEQALASNKLTETDKQLEVLKGRYDELTKEIDNCANASDRAALYTEQQSIVNKINDLATLASQYKGLTSAYNAWQSAESAGSERDMYESIISGFETVKDEISRGWLDDGTIKFLELLTGKTDLAGKSGKELKKIYDDLDNTITNTTYSVRDFFTVDKDGNSTNAGVYNFLDAIGQLEEEKFGGKDVVKRDKNGNIISFDFEVAGGDEAIAKALGISEELVQIMVRAADDAGFVVDIEGAYTQLADLKTEAEAARDALISLQKNGLAKLKGVDVNFNLDADGNDLVAEQEKAVKLLDKFKKDGKIDLKMEGAQQALDIAEYLTIKLDDLTEPKYMKLDTSKVEEDIREPLEDMQEFEKLAKEKHLLQLTGDTEKIKEVQDDMDEIAQGLEDLDKETKIKLGIDGLTSEEIASKLEKGEIDIPAELKLDVQMSDDLKDMRLMMMNQLGLASDNEVKLKVGYDIDESVVDSLTDEEKEVVVKYLAEHDEVDDYTPEQKEALVKYIADGGNLDNYTPEEKQAIVQYFADGGNVDNYTPEQKQAIVEYLTDSGDPDSWTPEQKEAVAKFKKDSAEVDNYSPEDKRAIAKFIKDSSEPDNYQPEGKTQQVTANLDSSEPDNYQPKDKSFTVKAFLKKVGDWATGLLSGGSKRSVVDGTANADGTAFINGTTGRAFRHGDWRIKDSGTALVGELGTETLVRDGRYYTIGDSGAEFIKYKKGDIIFNHKQTEELFRNGKVTSGGGRAKALVGGSAFMEGTAFKVGSTGSGGIGKVMHLAIDTATGNVKTTTKSSGSTGSGGGVGKAGGSPVGQTGGGGSSDKDKEKEEFEETFDWIETAISRIEREIDRLDKTANNVYKSWSERNSSLTSEITKVRDEIDLQQRAYNRYIQEANSVGLSSSWAEKVRNGKVDINTIKDEDLAKKIGKYKEWYDKALACEDAIQELKQTESELYAQRFENIQSQYDAILQGYEHTEAMLNEYISQAEEQGYIVSKKYYEALIDNEKSNIDELRREQADLIAERDKAVADGKIVKGSEAWYEQCAAIDEVTQAIEESTTAILEFDNAIRDIDWQIFDLIQERISGVTEEADFLIELMSNKKLFDDGGKLTSQGLATMALHGQNYNTNMYQADTYGEEVARLNAQIASDPYDQELINRRNEMLELQRESILAAEDEKNAIRDMVEEGIDLELDALQERIDKYNESIEAAKDLYDYQKNVQKQSEKIASLEKQRSAYLGDTSEEGKAKLQEIEVSLKEARENLEETEYDKYISDQQALLDTMYTEYELILNTRLDNIDYLLEGVIDSINAVASADGIIATALGSEGALSIAIGNNAISIKDTLTSEANKVGTTLSSAMNNIWSVGEGNAKSVLTLYGEDFKTKSATIITTLNGINTSVNSMISSLNKEAEKKTTANKTTTSAKKNPVTSSGSSSSNSKSSSSGGDGTAKIGDKVKFVSGQYYYDSQGTRPLGSQERGGYVYITNINKKSWATHPYHVARDKAGKYPLGWLKLNQLSGYAAGKKNFLDDEVAWTQEGGNQEYIVRPSDGAILTPIARKGSVLNAQASENLWNMTNSPAEFIKESLKLDNSSIPSASNINNNYTQHFENVVFSMPNVRGYNDLLTEMQKDPKFEKLILSMTIDRIAGKSSLAKGKSIR